MESDLSRVIDALPRAVWTALPDGQFDLYEQRWSEYTGLASRLVPWPGWQVAVHPEDLPGCSRLARQFVGRRAGRIRGPPARDGRTLSLVSVSRSSFADASDSRQMVRIRHRYRPTDAAEEALRARESGLV